MDIKEKTISTETEMAAAMVHLLLLWDVKLELFTHPPLLWENQEYPKVETKRSWP